MKTVATGPHKDHQLEELDEAKILLRQQFDDQVKEVYLYFI